MPLVTIHVPPRSYEAVIENGVLARAGSILSELLPQASRIFVAHGASGAPALGRQAD